MNRPKTLNKRGEERFTSFESERFVVMSRVQIYTKMMNRFCSNIALVYGSRKESRVAGYTIFG